MTDVIPFIEHFTYIGIFCILILGGLGFPFPEDGVLIVTGFLMAQHVINFFPSILIVYPSVLVADLILYSIGRRYGRNIVRHKRFSAIISAPTLARLEEKINRWGVLMVAAGRHMAGLRVPVFLISGIVGVPRLKFLLVDSISAVFSISFSLGLGYFAGNSLSVLKRDMARVDHILVLAGTTAVIVFILASFFRHRRKERSLSRADKRAV
ncbi:MAG: DedA family protein [Syntrophorhabdaceae bacterium]|nr:DedA family protein [Syntrophorhabdaceae bacterium]MDD4195868.1 DedA family protein [Syntrophorhabdaceae bacterium]HOC46105.1 DedA family protein [Syntrophorhabdaceae bacterium]